MFRAYRMRRRCNCSVSWDATGGNNLGPGCTTSKALLAAADAGAMAHSRTVPFSYYQAGLSVHSVSGISPQSSAGSTEGIVQNCAP